MADLYDELKAIEEASKGYNWDEGADIIAYDDEEMGYSNPEIKNPSGTTYGLRIINSSATASYLIKLFSFEGKDYYDAGRPGDISITAQSGYGPYPKFCQYVQSNPLEILGVRVTTTSSQIDQMSWNYQYFNVFGKKDSNVISFASFRTEQDYQSGIITVPLKHMLDYDSWVETTILPSTTVDLLLFIGIQRRLSAPLLRTTSKPVYVSKTGRQSIPSRPITRPQLPGGI